MEEDDSVETLDPIVDAERARQLSLFRPLGKEPVRVLYLSPCSHHWP